MLYVISEAGILRMITSTISLPVGGPGLLVQPLTASEEETYVRGGAPALAKRLGLAMPTEREE